MDRAAKIARRPRLKGDWAMQVDRAPEVAAFLKALSVCFLEATAGRPADAAFIERLLGKLSVPARAGGPPSGRDLRARDQLALALEGLRNADLAHRRLGQAFIEVEPLASWTQRTSHGPDAARFAAGHGNVMIVGPGGVEERDDLMAGVSLMAPGIRYPDHSHPPDELYLVLSEGEWRQNDGAWFTPGIGGTVRNPPGVVHAMRSGQTPLLAAWALLA